MATTVGSVSFVLLLPCLALLCFASTFGFGFMLNPQWGSFLCLSVIVETLSPSDVKCGIKGNLREGRSRGR